MLGDVRAAADGGAVTIAAVAPAVPAFPPARAGTLMGRARAAAGLGSLAILDQGLHAGTNFVVNVLLARWLAEAAYGGFALAFSGLLLAGTLHSALFTEPMLVHGANRYASRLPRYFGILLWGNVVFLVPLALGLVAIALVFFGPGPARDALVGLGIATPPILFLWQTRRAFYIEARPSRAAAGGALYLVLLVAAVVALRGAGALSIRSALFAMGGASLATALFVGARLRPLAFPAPPTGEVREVARSHWEYGRWLAASLPLIWFSANIYYSVLSARHGLEAAGSLRAVMNLAMPALHGLAALSLLLVPALARRLAREGRTAMLRAAGTALAGYVAIAAGFLVLLLVGHRPILSLLYGGKYGSLGGVDLLLVGILPFGAALTGVAGSALRALERPRAIFWSYGVSAIVTLVAGVPLVVRLGPRGALAGMALSGFVSAGMMVAALAAARRQGGGTACS
jgi:O-antigen/teichoic acid export membrane protein